MRATIARRMQESVRDIPHFYTTISIDMSQALSLRASFKKDETLKPVSINHLILKAAAYALGNEPRVNCALKDNHVVNTGEINIGLVTSVEGGLLIPVIQNADELPIRDLALQARAAIDRARAGKPSSQDLSGGTFTTVSYTHLTLPTKA